MQVRVRGLASHARRATRRAARAAPRPDDGDGDGPLADGRTPKPHNEDAHKFLEHGDLFIGEGKCVAARVKYQHGRDIEPGNPKLKQRADAVRRYLTQRGELDKMISKYKGEVAQMNAAEEAEEQGFEAPEDMVSVHLPLHVRMPSLVMEPISNAIFYVLAPQENDADDFFNKDKGSKQKVAQKKKKKINDQVAEMEIADE